MEHDTFGVKKVFDPPLCAESVPGLAPNFTLIFFFYDTFMYIWTYDIFETITSAKRKQDILGAIRRSFWGIYTRAEHLEGVDITRRLTIS